MAWWHKFYTKEEVAKEYEEIDVLYQTDINIRGNEPFVKFGQPGMIVNFTDYARGHPASHNLIELWTGIPLHKLQKGEKLRFSVQRVNTYVEPVKERWFEKLWNKLRK